MNVAFQVSSVSRETSQVHKALQMDDILGQIFSFLRTSGSQSQGHPGADKKTPYYAALVCRRFLSHGLDSLWYSMTNLNLLISLIPNTKMMGDGGVALKKPLVIAHLTVFERYAERIKEYYEYPDSPRIRIPVILDILRIANRRHLLPNLRFLHLDCVDSDLELRQFGCFFLGPNLRRIHFPSISDQEQICYILPYLARAAPHLQSLTFSGTPIPDDFLKLTGSFSSLSELSTDNDFMISPDSFTTTFPFARHLVTWHASSIVLSADPRWNSATLPRFPALKVLHLFDFKCEDDTAKLFLFGIFPILETLRLDVNTDARVGSAHRDWPNLFQNMFFRGNHLRSVKISSRGFKRNLSTSEDLDIFTVLKDTHPQDLEILEITVPLVNALLPSSMRILGDTFPRLTEFSIKVGDSEQLCSFEDLSVLASSLPCLTTLRIGIDGKLSPRRGSIPVLCHGLLILDVRPISLIENPLEFAHAVDKLFPFVKLLDNPPGTMVPVPRLDEAVQALKVMKACRGDQEIRLAMRTRPPPL